LAIERPTVTDARREVPYRRFEAATPIEHDLQHRRIAMDVLVRVEVGWIAANEPTKRFDLAIHFSDDGRGIACGNNLVKSRPAVVSASPFAEIDVKSDAQSGACTSIGGRFCRRRPSHHQARARYDAVLVSFDHALVNARRLAKVIGIDD
jgi:hypothetical protein